MAVSSVSRRKCALDRHSVQLLPRFMLPTAGEQASKCAGVVDEVPRRATEGNSRRRRRHGPQHHGPQQQQQQQQQHGGRRGYWVPWRSRRLAIDSALLVLFLFLVLLARVEVAAAEEPVDIRPAWMPLGASVAEVFRSSEVLQMYHLQATAMLYEQGGLNHDMSFFLTAVAFYSLERPEVKVSMAYHPTNMTISLLPDISADGRQLRWDHQSASTSYVMGVDQAYWTADSYMGETTGAFFSYAVEFSLDYHRANPRYQPFSVYEDYPGREYLRASSCDEYVWALLSAAQERGVRLTPALLPQQHKIIIYSHSVPETVLLNGGSGNNSSGSGSGSISGSGSGSVSWSSSPSWASSASTDAAGEAGGGEGGGGASSTNSSSNGGDGGGEERGAEEREEEEGGGAVVPGANRTDRGANSAHSGANSANDVANSSNDGASSANVSANSTDATANGTDSEGRRRGRQLAWGSLFHGGQVNKTQEATPVPGTALIASSSGKGNTTSEPGGGGGGGVGVGAETAAAGAEGLVTLEPVVSPEEQRGDGGVVEASIETPAPVTVLDDWQQVVGYYQSLQVCLQERKFSFVTSLKDFVRYFDCLDDVAFISIRPHEYYKVNLTSTKLDHISLPEELPEVTQRYEGFTRVDTAIALWVLMILACGIHGILWQAAVIQHWLKAYGYGDTSQVEDALSDEDEDVPRVERHPSFTRQITTEYLRLGNMFLGERDDFNAAAAASAGAVALNCPGDDNSSGVDCERGGGEGGDDGCSSNGDKAPQRRQTIPPTPPPPKRGGRKNGVAQQQAVGVEMVETAFETTGAAAVAAAARIIQEKNGGDTDAFLGSAYSEHKGSSSPLPSSPPAQTQTAATAVAAARRAGLYNAGSRGNRESGPYSSRGAYNGSDRWIGFAGSPRGERSGGRRGHTDSKDGVGVELLGHGQGSVPRTESGVSDNRESNNTEREATTQRREGDGKGEESEAFLEAGLEELLSDASR